MEYLYDASGAKKKKAYNYVGRGVARTDTVDYLGGFQYKNGVLQFFPTNEGYAKAPQLGDLPVFSYIYNYTDHLGNVRLSYGDKNRNGSISPVDEIVEENNYYAFGMKHEGYNYNAGDGIYKYKYNGKEFQDELGLNLYDYGARNYDPAIGRWMNIDPLAEKFMEMSPFVYGMNNPIYFIDPDGMASDGWIKRDENGQTSMTYDPNVNNVNEANAAGYTKVVSVSETAKISSASGSYSYDLNADGSVTNSSDGSNITFHKPIVKEGEGVVGGAFQTGQGTKIYTSNIGNSGNPFTQQRGNIESMDFSSPFFPAAGIFKSLSATSAATPRVFWSGGNVAKGAAADFASANGMKTLEMTTTGSIMNTISPYLPRNVSNPIWNRLSSNFASGASGEVNFFTTAAGPRATSIWSTVESPILRSNGVNIITHTIP